MDRGEYFRSQGYQVGGGALEFYYVSVRTHKTTQVTEICLCGEISWSNDLHDPNVTMQKISKDPQYNYSRMGPFPRRLQAEQAAMDLALKVHQDPTKYGMASSSGPREMPPGFTKQPSFF